jgi:riboflavin kinase/FMN adenylyltransferase
MKFKGIIKKGAGRGKALGFPTANLDAPENLDLQDGVYFGTLLGAPSLIFIGPAETFGQTERKIEVHVLNFNLDIYGQEVEGETEKFFRPNMKFATAEELIAQMQKDKQAGIEYFHLPVI